MSQHGEILLTELDRLCIEARREAHLQGKTFNKAATERDEQLLHVLRGILGRLDSIEAEERAEDTRP